MATYFWTGASGTQWSTAGSWNPSGPPGNGDTAIFDDCSISVTAGASATALTKWIITPRYTGNIGASGAPIDAVSATMLLHEGSGDEAWLGNGSVSRAKIYPRSMGANAVHFVGGDTGQLRIVSGQIHFDSTTSMGTLTILQPAPEGAYVGPEVVFGASLTWSSGCKVIVHGGRAQLYSGPSGAIDNDFVDVCGGGVWQRGGTVDHAFVNGGVYRHDAGTVTAGYLSEGVWNSTQSGEARTLTTLIQCGGESLFSHCAEQGKPGTFIYLGGETTLPEESYSL